MLCALLIILHLTVRTETVNTRSTGRLNAAEPFVTV